MAGMLINVGCGTTTGSYYGKDTVPINNNIFHNLATITEDNAFSVPKDDRERHQRCVFFVLEETDNGETCHWVNHDTHTAGYVKVVYRYTTLDKVCHVFFTQLNTVYHNKHWQDTACWSPTNEQWTFVARR